MQDAHHPGTVRLEIQVHGYGYGGGEKMCFLLD